MHTTFEPRTQIHHDNNKYVKIHQQTCTISLVCISISYHHHVAERDGKEIQGLIKKKLLFLQSNKDLGSVIPNIATLL